MKKVILKNFKHGSRTIEKLDVFVADDDCLILIPSFYSLQLYYHLKHYIQIDKKLKNGINQTQLIELDISKVTASQYISHLDRFLRYLHQSGQVSPDKNWLMLNHNLPPEIINHYINDVFILEQKHSMTSATQCVSALSSYYNYLTKIGLTSYKSLSIAPGNKTIAKKNTMRREAVKYLPQSTRNALYRQCTTMRNKLILKCGSEVGTRAKEIAGFYLNDFEYGQKTRKGLLTLFDEMKANPNQTVFTYFLPGVNSKAKPGKGGMSRNLYIEAGLLEEMQEYYQQERPVNSESNAFFLKVDNSTYGESITEEQASSIFKNAKDKLLQVQDRDNAHTYKIHKDHVFHVMRHSFGTDKFYEYAKNIGNEIDAITANSAVMIQIAELLGHSLAGKDKGLTVTRRYIRSAREKMSMEGLI
ncbi:tyrosine-type recombinase/integrase [Pseudoalteromonas sp. 5-MNA-CIBAN-0065]|uniref:tyrosine-type recombinase/integrase n=1 Tax=unclassified Pseudoalteromonas TaxID=194690 RepID=UPI003329C6E5